MFKKTASIVLLAAIVATPLRFIVPGYWYCVNYEYIAHELCVNKDNPEIDCNGMCQLKKMMQQEHQHDGHSSAPQVNQQQRMNLFFSETLLMPESPSSFSLSSIIRSDRIKSLWFGEPVSPPPRKACFRQFS